MRRKSVARLFLGWIAGSVLGTFVFFLPGTLNDLFHGRQGAYTDDIYSGIRLAASMAQLIFALLVPAVMTTAWLSRKTDLKHRFRGWLVVALGSTTFGLIGFLSSKFFPVPELSFRYFHFVSVGVISTGLMWGIATKTSRAIKTGTDGNRH